MNDETVHIETMQDFFEIEGAKIVQVSSVKEAFDMLYAQLSIAPFHVLISDLCVPRGLDCESKYPQFFEKRRFSHNQLGLDFIRALREGTDGFPAQDRTKLSIVVYAMQLPKNYQQPAFEYGILNNFGPTFSLNEKTNVLLCCHRFHVLGDKTALNELYPENPGYQLPQHPIEQRLEKDVIHPYYRNRGYGD
ncbi:MAG: hypothetical protein AB7U41_06405 [Dongiaceae bacterium]